KKDHPKGSAEQKVGDFYASGMDTVAIEKAGYAPLKPMLAKIDAVKDYKELLQLLAGNFKEGDGDLLGLYVGADERNSAKNILVMYQTGLSLPEKDYYTKTDSITVMQRNKLVQHIAAYNKLTGMDAAKADAAAAAVLKLETAIAASHLTPVEQRDPVKNYNKMSVADLDKMAPNLAIAQNLSLMGIQTDSVNVSQPKYYQALSKLLASESIDAWKAKVRYDYIS
ncbi:MAG TPA: peptidase M13, partial [Chitinophagaceae bacterium]|nr:peptidase M13 [Chitinophagaceae bacterium]